MAREVIPRRVIGVTSHAAGLCMKYRANQNTGANNTITAFGGGKSECTRKMGKKAGRDETRQLGVDRPMTCVWGV